MERKKQKEQTNVQADLSQRIPINMSSDSHYPPQLKKLMTNWLQIETPPLSNFTHTFAQLEHQLFGGIIDQQIKISLYPTFWRLWNWTSV